MGADPTLGLIQLFSHGVFSHRAGAGLHHMNFWQGAAGHEEQGTGVAPPRLLPPPAPALLPPSPDSASTQPEPCRNRLLCLDRTSASAHTVRTQKNLDQTVRSPELHQEHHRALEPSLTRTAVCALYQAIPATGKCGGQTHEPGSLQSLSGVPARSH